LLVSRFEIVTNKDTTCEQARLNFLEMNAASDILIIGGGVIGLAIAVELKLRGATVTVVSRDFKQASTLAAAGMLAPQAEAIPKRQCWIYACGRAHCIPNGATSLNS
jgi:2-polyprenyl-6-methoxyphenol hydroxylase-like FAD-dependent oxidoreductase